MSISGGSGEKQPYGRASSAHVSAMRYHPRRWISTLRYVDHRELRTGSKYLIHADGREDDPHCVSMCISHNDDVAVSDLNSTYFHILSGIRDLLEDSAGNPVVFEYIQDSAASLNSSQTHPQDINISLLSRSAGYYLACDKPMLRCRDVANNSFARWC